MASEERVAGLTAALGGWLAGFVGDLIKDASRDYGAGGFSFGAGFGDDAAEDVVGDFLQRFGVFEAAAHGAQRGKKFAGFEEVVGVEVVQRFDRQPELGAVITGQGENEFGP